MGDGNDWLLLNVAANEYTWSSNFDITLGNGNDFVNVTLTEFLPDYENPYNRNPQLTTANITVGNGNDTVDLSQVSGNITVGNGNNSVFLSDTASTVQVGTGTDRISSNSSDSIIWLGAGNDTVTIEGEARPSLTATAFSPSRALSMSASVMPILWLATRVRKHLKLRLISYTARPAAVQFGDRGRRTLWQFRGRLGSGIVHGCGHECPHH